MHKEVTIPVCRDLDSVYYRVVREGKYVNRCFTDLTEFEQDEIMAEYNAEQLRRLCRYLCISLRQIGDTLDLVREE